MKLTDENGGEYEEIKILGEYICTHEDCQKKHGMMVVRKLKKPANPMPEPELKKLEERVYVLEKVLDELRDAFCKISRQITLSGGSA